MIGLRTRTVRFILVAVGVLSLATMYVTPTVEAILTPGPTQTLPAVTLPLAWFPPLAPPKLHAAPAIPHVKPVAQTHAPAAARTHKQRRHRIKVPVVRSHYSFVPPAAATSSSLGASSKPATYAASPAVAALAAAVAGAPVVTDETGTPEAVAQPAAPTTTDTSVGADPTSLAPGSTTAPAPVADATDASTPASPPDERTAATTSTDTTQVYNSTMQPAATAEQTQVSNDTAGAPPAAAPTDTTTTDQSTTPDPGAAPVPATTDTQSTDAASSGVAASAPADTTTTNTDTTAIPATAPAAPAAPAAPIAASAPAAPSAWTVHGTSVSVAASGSNVVVTVDGTSTTRAAADLTTLFVGGTSLTIDLSGGPLGGLPISFDGGAISVTGGAGASWTYDGGAGTITGNGLAVSFTHVTSLNAGSGTDTLHGPAADSTWNVTGSGSGTVGGASFSGFESLVGAANNQDKFVIGPNGSLAGGVDGGPGGFDTLVLAGGSYKNVTYRTVDKSSGSVMRDGNAIAYTGLEPVINNGSGANQSYSGTTGDDAITIADDGTPDSFVITANTSESVQITNVSTIDSISIDTLDGNDSVTYQSIDSAFHGVVNVIGSGTGSKSLIAANTGGGAWNLTGIDSGSYTPTGGPTINYQGVGNLNGGSDNAAFTFGVGGGVSGSLAASG
ncbi:MAG TPA: hypothetical protein VI408_05320, partial [Gaiellaceae bacterium]